VKYLGPPQSGSLAAETFSRNPFGQYSRARVGRGGVPARPLTGAVAAWQSLTYDQQLAWGAWARTYRRKDSLGQTIEWSGYLAFVRAWRMATNFGATLPTDPPDGWVTLSFELQPLFISTGSTVQSDVDWVTNGEAYIQWEIAYPYSSAGTNSPPGRGAHWRFNTATNISAGSGTTSANWNYAPFTPPAGSRAWWRVRLVGLDWRVTPWVNAGFVAFP
jgi:hypothetical protein